MTKEFKVYTRSDWGARSPKRVTKRDLAGPSILHWLGSGSKWNRVLDDAREQWMAGRLRSIQNYHMDGKGWSDIAYSFAVDPWGLGVWELRGLDVNSGANGTTTWNNKSHAILVMNGLGDPNVTNEALTVIDELIDHIAEAGSAERTIKAHREVRQTNCPGDYLTGLLALFNDNAFEAKEPVFVQKEHHSTGEPVAIFTLGNGYCMVDANGRVRSQGTSVLGDLAAYSLDSPIVDAEGTPSGKGYYMVAADGGIFGFGDAIFHGSVRQALDGRMPDKPITSIEVIEGGYYVVAADGGIFGFGSAKFMGSFVHEVG
jgi:hypothetical protein